MEHPTKHQHEVQMNQATFRLRLANAGLRPADLARECGKTPVQIWRWGHGRTPVPKYAKTIIEKTERINELESQVRKLTDNLI